ncbi:lysosomal acid lipase/cholesteryl ester hydrolase-like isoform X1 [Porites lutea]|uniref:lysosomal acid lipase/cholesteryl ester hydrolase-like isoform X1 n=1 Tax=Porites lutea TaxID=51062 RepID=UPI003CC5B39A
MSIVSFLMLYSTVLVTAAVAAKLSKLHYLPETDMNVTQIIRYNGYPAEEYSVVTDDGYIIYIQRIPSGRNQDPSSGPKPVIFLQHGLLCSSSNWVVNLPNEGFAFILADAGFDVWLGNVRGNTYGLRHVKYPVHSDEFWNFSWDEMASQDLPAVLNFVTNKTSQSSIYYAAHSQGTTMAFAEFSRNKELAKKVKKFFAMGPVATVGHMESPIKYLADAIDEIEILFELLGVRDFLPSDVIIHWLAKHVCSDKELETFCSDIIFIICGFDKKQLNETRLPIYYTHTPAGTSVRNIVHFAQMYKSKKFQMYDYGSSKENKKHYGQPTPPQYNASDMTVPVALYWAQNDWLADPTDVKALLPLLPNKLYNKPIENWDHLDFIWGMDAAKIVYDDIIRNITSDYMDVFNPGFEP